MLVMVKLQCGCGERCGVFGMNCDVASVRCDGGAMRQGYSAMIDDALE